LHPGAGNRYLEEALLEQLFHELNRDHFRGELPLPKLGWNSRLSSTAGRFCTGSRNPIFPRPPVIEVASYLRDVQNGEMHVRDTVLHEMIHYYLWFKRRPHGHTPEFSQILKTVGAKRYNTVPKERDWKHWYECPSCSKGFHTRRKLNASACLTCCERFNAGRFTDKFLLVRKAPRPAVKTPVTILRPAEAVAAPESPIPSASLPPSEIIRRLEQLKAMLRDRSRAKTT
jgi:predicted SprT family Zn-dependent metalloprotease